LVLNPAEPKFLVSREAHGLIWTLTPDYTAERFAARAADAGFDQIRHV
jgi:hypothetical protein